MGFGSVFIGYLITFVLYWVADALGIGGLALLLGYLVMLPGLLRLSRFHRAFLPASAICLPLLLTSAYESVASVASLLLWSPAFLQTPIATVVGYVSTGLEIALHILLLYGIRILAAEVDLKVLVTKALRNMIFVFMYAFAYVLYRTAGEGTTNEMYFTTALRLVRIVMLACMFLILLNCAKDICPAGEEDQPPKQYRMKWLNKINDTFEKNKQKAIDSTREAAEETLRRRQEARKSKNSQKKKRR